MIKTNTAQSWYYLLNNCCGMCSYVIFNNFEVLKLFLKFYSLVNLFTLFWCATIQYYHPTYFISSFSLSPGFVFHEHMVLNCWSILFIREYLTKVMRSFQLFYSLCRCSRFVMVYWEDKWYLIVFYWHSNFRKHLAVSFNTYPSCLLFSCGGPISVRLHKLCQLTSVYAGLFLCLMDHLGLRSVQLIWSHSLLDYLKLVNAISGLCFGTLHSDSPV